MSDSDTVDVEDLVSGDNVEFVDEFEHSRYCLYCETYVDFMTWVAKSYNICYYPSPKISDWLTTHYGGTQKVYRYVGRKCWYHEQCKRNCVLQNISLFKQINGRSHMLSTDYKVKGGTIQKKRNTKEYRFYKS